MFLFLAIVSVIYHVRTFLLMPKTSLPPNAKNASLFKISICAEIFGITSYETNFKEEIETEKSNIWRSLKDPFYWQFVIAFNILAFRIKTAQGWIFPWIEWTFSE